MFAYHVSLKGVCGPRGPSRIELDQSARPPPRVSRRTLHDAIGIGKRTCCVHVLAGGTKLVQVGFMMRMDYTGPG